MYQNLAAVPCCCALLYDSTVLADVRPSSLVLVDELGKGTEVISGTALAAAMLRQLAASGAM